MSDLYVGARVQHLGHRATVRFLGRLKGRPEHTWVGLEWDDHTRGKHSGAVDGVQYFHVDRPGSASFIKASKLGAAGRVSFEAALKQRYITDASDTSYREQRHEIGGRGGKVEFRFGDCMLPMRRLKFVNLSGLGVAAGLEEEKRLGDLLAVMEELRLADSLFESMRVVHQILNEFLKLSVLDVSRNVLGGSDSPAEAIEEARHDCLHTLIMNGCNVAWKDIRTLCGRTPNLRELRVYNCSIASLQQPEPFVQTFARLQLLDLDQNAVSWATVVSHLGALPRLRELYLSRNGLEDCDALLATEAGEGAVFGRLEILSLAGNKLDGWRVVTALHGLPALRQLRLAGNPIMADEEDVERESLKSGVLVLTGRMHAIARVGDIQLLDGSSISEDERLYAEKKYVIDVCAAGANARGMAQAKLENPRLEELWAKFELDDTGGMAGGRKGVTGSMQGDLVKVQMEASAKTAAGRQCVTRHVPRNVTIERVKRIANRLLRIRGVTEEVFIQVGGDIKEVEDESRDIDYWLSFGDEGEGIKVICA